jgi:hypothetical protein
MTLPEQIKLVNALIRENPDVRICDYIAVLSEVKGIIPRTTKKVDTRQKTFTPAQELFIVENHAVFTAKEISFGLTLDLKTVYNIGTSHRLKFKAAFAKKKPIPIYGKTKRIAAYVPDKPKEKIIRPAAEYDNLKSNYA